MAQSIRGLVICLAMAAPIAAARADAETVAPRSQLSLTLAPQEHVCTVPAGLRPWRDASDPVSFAAAPTAKLNQHELWAVYLAPLVATRYDEGTLRLVLIGMPQPRVGFTLAGWRQRWPIC